MNNTEQTKSTAAGRADTGSKETACRVTKDEGRIGNYIHARTAWRALLLNQKHRHRFKVSLYLDELLVEELYSYIADLERVEGFKSPVSLSNFVEKTLLLAIFHDLSIYHAHRNLMLPHSRDFQAEDLVQDHQEEELPRLRKEVDRQYDECYAREHAASGSEEAS